MKRFSREIINPVALMKNFWPDADLSHITYDPNLKRSDRQYWRIEQGAHDGTILFTIELFEKLLCRLVNKTTHYAPDGIDGAVDIEYTIGPIGLATVYGKVYLGCSKERMYSGQRERARIAVKTKLIYE